jgi:hypothetical protein
MRDKISARGPFDHGANLPMTGYEFEREARALS